MWPRDAADRRTRSRHPRRSCRRRWLAGVALGLAGCGAQHHSAPLIREPPPRLTRAHPCAVIPGFICASLVVPLDHAGQATGHLTLAVGVQRLAGAPHGDLLFLTGGPGQPGVSLIAHVRSRLGSALDGYRLVMFDQRGTGAGALNCPALQAAAGSSDLVVPPPGAVAACARAIGPARRFYSTPETVADIERLRRALGVPRLALDGVSYGSYVAERYALAYPGHVSRLVLDSVVPQTGADALYLAAFQAVAPVLRDVCARQRCGWDPARDVARVVQAQRDGPELLDALVGESVAFPSFPGVLNSLHAAAAGQPAALRRFIAAVQAAERAPAGALSQGLHESTLCLDLAPPWRPAAGPAARTASLTEAADRLAPAATFPFGRAAVLANGLAQGCLQWPATDAPAVADGNPGHALPPVPVLLLAGGHDLSTPLAWAQAEAARAPEGQLVVVPGSGHSLQTRRGNAAVRRIVTRFLSR